MLMLLLVQAAATVRDTDVISAFVRIVSPFVLAFLGYMQHRSAKDRAEMRDEIKEVREDLKEIRDEVTTLNAHVGVDGNGIMAQLVVITNKIDALSTEIAEGRGARHIRPGS